MASNDIYNSRRTYNNLVASLPHYLVVGKSNPIYNKLTTHYYKLLHDEKIKNTNLLHVTTPNYKKRKYCIKVAENLLHFAVLCNKMDSKDLSYVRRNKYIRTLVSICHYAKIDLAKAEREDIDLIVTNLNNHYKSLDSRKDMIKAIKYLWKTLFPEKDEKGRIDDSIVPYAVRHLSGKVDVSKEKNRGDRLTWKEFEQLLQYFNFDKRIQAYLMVAMESLGRPQEILYTKISSLELHDGYAKLHIDEHGKEGTGYLQCIDSFPYIIKWLEEHPRKHEKQAWLFCNTANNKSCEQLTPVNINKKLRIACKHLDIDKPITCYSLKRNGVTFRRAKGESDLEIQHAARWTSTKQLKVYDQSNADDALKRQLARRGIIKDKEYEELLPKNKTCPFCSHVNTFHADLCGQCKRPLDASKIKVAAETQETQMMAMQRNIELLTQNMVKIQEQLKAAAMEKIQR